MAFLNSLKEVLNKLQSEYPELKKRLQEAQAVSRWEKAVGPMIAKHARAFRVEGGILWVEVDHPAWKMELHHRKHQILKILNDNAAETAAPVVLRDLFLIEKKTDHQTSQRNSRFRRFAKDEPPQPESSPQTQSKAKSSP